MTSFVHLHVHSQYSILDAAASVEAIAEGAAAFEMPAVALTDHGNMYGAVEFYKACQEAKVKPILGCEFYVAPNSRLDKQRMGNARTAHHLTLLARNKQGYHNLCKLSTIGFLEGFYYNPRIDEEVLKKYSEGIICLSGCMSSRVAQLALTAKKEEVVKCVLWYKELFGENYYLELQRHAMSDADIQTDGVTRESWLLQQYRDYISNQKKINDLLIEIGKECSIPIVATNDSHFMLRKDWQAHEILLNIQSGEPSEIWEMDSLGNPKMKVPNPRRRTYPSHECYFKSSQQMQSLFSDLPQALASTLEIAEKCHVELDFKSRHYPTYVPPKLEGKQFSHEEQVKESQEFLRKLCAEGIPKLYTAERLAKVKERYPEKDPMEVVVERLNYELSVIIPKGMCDYLLIVWDFIHWAKSSGIPVGPGRGSGAGSIVLYLIGVTEIEPLRFNLFFERFINPERISYPDIDVDICMDRRNEVIAYTLKKYGKENVAQIITFGTMKARMTIKDVGRVLNVPLAKVNAIAKLVPEDLNITLVTALEKDPDLRSAYENDEEVRRIIDIGKTLEGSIRSTGIHAAGIVICGDLLTNYIPLCVAKDSDMTVSQFSMKPVELMGLLKIDFLGLKTLTCIKICIDAVKESTGKVVEPLSLSLDDGPTFALLNQGKTQGIFQLESGGMQELARNLHLDRFEEIIAVNALYRPGPMDMIPSFINRKHGREPIDNDHIWMKEILAETYGIMVYQEQVMQIASRLANYTLGEGDVLRKAMGKKDLDQMIKQREKFIKGVMSNGIDEATATRIFDKMEKFAAYGFNKSHAAAYGFLSYVTAYFKANYPKEWLAALMTCDLHDLTKVAKFIQESQSMGIAVLPPDINESLETFAATPNGIRFAMTGIKGVGSGVVEAIIVERKKNGPFNNLYQFIKRIDITKVGKKVIENLVDAGCFDGTGWSRDALRLSIEPMYDAAAREQKDAAAGHMSLFARLGETEGSRFAKPPSVVRPSSKEVLLLKEKELLGLYLTGHPLGEYKDRLKKLSCISLDHVSEMDHDNVFRAAFLIEDVTIKIANKSQKKFAVLNISDGCERFELVIWPELYEQKVSIITENRLIYAVLQVDKKDGDSRLVCRWIDDLTRVNEEMIAECDRVFDKAKQMVGKYMSFNRNKESKKVESSEKQQTTTQKDLRIKIDADRIRYSDIVLMKELFSQYRGETSIHLDFVANGRSMANLHISKPWGVIVNKEMLDQLGRLPSIAIDEG